jgi:hypothetical protein
MISIFQLVFAPGFLHAIPLKRKCLDTNVDVPIKVQNSDYFCGEKLGEGKYGTFYSLVKGKHQKGPLYGIKVFHSEDPKVIKDEVDQINFVRKYIKSIQMIRGFSIQYKQKKRNYIIKPRIHGTNLFDLYQSGCFLESKELKDAKDIKNCKKLTGNSTGNELLEGLRGLLKELKNYDDQTHNRFLISDLHGKNILWDKENKEMVIIDFIKQEMPLSSLHYFVEETYPDGEIFNENPYLDLPEYLVIRGVANSRLLKGCMEKQKIQDLFKEFLPDGRGFFIEEIANQDCSNWLKKN